MEDEKRNVLGGPLDGSWIEPHDTKERVQVSKRTPNQWSWYRWDHESNLWVFVRSQKTVLK